jgi:hypothetical protein
MLDFRNCVKKTNGKNLLPEVAAFDCASLFVFTQAVHVNGMFSFINKKRKINRLS